jgi:pimeloyl-ACP methyl ester carboxylesterase
VWPGSETLDMRDGDRVVNGYSFPELVRGGTAVAVPVVKGMWQRGPVSCPMFWSCRGDESRRRIFYLERTGWKQLQDLHRAVDYLETRDELAADRIGFLGISWGGNWTPFLAGPKASRFRAAISMSGGYSGSADPPEWDPVHWAPRVGIPTLFLNGQLDYLSPIQRTVDPLFRSLGAAPEDKRLHQFPNTGHWPLPEAAMLREMSDWLDRYLGPVAATRGSKLPAAQP